MLLLEDISPSHTHFEKIEILLLVTFKLFTKPCIQLLKLQAAFNGWKNYCMLYLIPERQWLFFGHFLVIIAKFNRHHPQSQFL